MPKSSVRLAQVVQECGRPEPVTLWTDPNKDPDFQADVRANRVMTVIQETLGTHKDFGIVGFHRVEHGSYWVFPKPLGKFEGKRIIGIKYDLLEIPDPKDPVRPAAEPVQKTAPKRDEKLVKPSATKPPPKSAPEKPRPKPTTPRVVRYRVTIRCTAMVDLVSEVEAKTAKQAGELALSLASNPVEFPAEKIVRKVVQVRRSTKT